MAGEETRALSSVQSRAAVSHPHQHLAVFVDRELLGVDEFSFSAASCSSSRSKLQLERPIGEPPALLEEGGDLVDDRIQVHQLALRQLFQQRLGLLQIFGVKPFGEPVVDFG